MKKFEQEAIKPNHEKWENSIKRQRKLYLPVYGQSTMRTDFDRDYTRIINCNAYRRLKHKTQVFFAPQNDHICTRIEHVNLVESISYTIANYFELNTELTKAISVAHDLGHSPFGHQGEKLLSEISMRECGEEFWHGKNGLNYIDNIELLKDNEDKFKNLLLTYAVRDGVISHSGYVDEKGIKPRNEYIDLNKFKFAGEYSPYTWEACVVKISDNISYLGRDIEDAKNMGLLTEKDIEKINKLTEKVRINNSSITNYLVVDLCENSSLETGFRFSDEALETMNIIKKFNVERIYNNKRLEPTIRYFTVLITEIFYMLKNEFNGTKTINNLKKMSKYYPTISREFTSWLSNYAITEDRKEEMYDNKIIYDLENQKDYCRAIIDYMSGMTDNYIVQVYNELISF